MAVFLSRNDSARWIVPTLVGVGATGLGAGLMYLLDPDLGRRRRKQILRRSERVTGAAFATLRRAFRRYEASGAGLAARVRGRLAM